jgi:hypothetical protein
LRLFFSLSVILTFSAVVRGQQRRSQAVAFGCIVHARLAQSTVTQDKLCDGFFFFSFFLFTFSFFLFRSAKADIIAHDIELRESYEEET